VVYIGICAVVLVILSGTGDAAGIMDTSAWDGYPADRRRLLAHLRDETIGNNVVLSGDFIDSTNPRARQGLPAASPRLASPRLASPLSPSALRLRYSGGSHVGFQEQGDLALLRDSLRALTIALGATSSQKRQRLRYFSLFVGRLLFTRGDRASVGHVARLLCTLVRGRGLVRCVLVHGLVSERISDATPADTGYARRLDQES